MVFTKISIDNRNVDFLKHLIVNLTESFEKLWI